MLYIDEENQGRIMACDTTGCRTVLTGAVALSLAISPDDRRVLFSTPTNRGVATRWIALGGGEAHELTQANAPCSPGWSASGAVWTVGRQGGTRGWTEVDADSGRRTGKFVPTSHDCSDGIADPNSPVAVGVRAVVDRTSQLRLLPTRYLPAH